MTLVGFKRAVLGIYDDYWNIIKTHVFDGKTDEGATVTAEISGLSSEPIKTYSPSTAFNLLVVGTDDVTVNLSVIDMSVDFESAILGYNKKTNLFYGGETTSPPYVSLLLESSDIRGDKVFLGFFRGKTVLNDLSMRTETTENEELEATTYTMYFESNENNDTYIKGIGENAEDELKDLLFPGAFPSRPYNLKASNIGYSNFDLSWEHSTSKKFNVYLNGRLHMTTPYKTITIDGLSENTNYYVSVTSIGSAGESDPTATIKVKTKEYVSLPPENPYVTEVSYDKATFVWTNNSADKYSVYLDGKFYKETTDSYIYISDLKPNSSHTVKVRGYKFGKWSDFSKDVTFATKKIPTVVINNVYTYPTSIRVLIDSHDLQYKAFLNNKEIAKTGNDITFDTLTPSTQYTLKFVAVYNGITSEETVKTVGTTAIPQVTNLETKDVTMTTATATWSGSSQSYEVYLNNEFKETVTETSYKLTDLAKNTDYTVKVIGIYDGYKSEPVEDSFKTKAVPVPYELKTTYLDYKVATVTWKGQGDSFNVYVNGSLENNTSDKLYTFSLIPENEYTVQIAIVLGEDEGAKSDKLVFKAKQVPSVTDLRVHDSGIDRLSFAWNGVTENYEVTFDGKTSMTTDTSFSADNLEQGKTYKIRVRAAYSGKFSPYEELEAKTTSVPIPTNVTVSDITYKNAKVSWNGQADKYKIYLNDEFVKETTQLSYTLDNLVPKMTYNVQIQAFVGTAESDKTTAKTFVTSNVPIVTGLYVQETGYDKLVFTWDGLDSYKIDVDGVITEQTENVFTIDKLTQGTTKTIKVANVYKNVVSDYSTAQATTKQVVDITGLKLVSKDYKSLSFTWDNVTDQYNIIANDINVNVSDTTYTLSDLNADTRYTFKVRAMQDNFAGEFASIMETTESVPVPKMEAIPFEDSIKVNLTDGTGQYEVKIDNDPYTLISGNTHEFKDLVADTEYIIYARSVYKGSYSQAITENVTTEMLAIDKPIVKQAWANRDSVTLVMENTSYQYSISVDDASAKTYGSTAVITGLNKGTSYKFTIKSLSGGNYSEPVEITRNTASGTEITNIGHIKLSKGTAKFFWTGAGQSFDVMLDGNSEDRYTGSEQTCEFSGLEDGKDHRLTIIQNVDGKWSTWYYYNFRLEDETVISDDKPTEPTVDVEPPKNLTTSLITETSARVSFAKDANAEKTNIYLNDKLNGSTANSYYDLTSLTEDTSYSVYGKSVLDEKESEKSETITFRTDKKVGNTIADRVTFEPEVSLAKYRRSTGSSLIPYSVRSHKVDIKGLQTDETFNVETYNMFMYTKEKHTRDSFTMGLKSLYYDSEFVSTDKIQIEFSDGSKTEYTFNFEIE